MAKKISQIPTSVLFSWLEALFSSNKALDQMRMTFNQILNSDEVHINQSFAEKKMNEIGSKIGFNNNAIQDIEKELKKRMKAQYPSVCVFTDLDIISKSIDDEIAKEKKQEKGLKKHSMIQILSTTTRYNAKNILELNQSNKLAELLLQCLENQEDYALIYPEELNTSEKRIYRVGFLKIVLTHLYAKRKKASAINDMLRTKFEVNLTDRSIDRKRQKFKKIFL